MKKIFTLIAAALFAVSVNAQKEVDLPLSVESWGWGWSCEASMEGDVLVGTFSGAYGGLSTGYGTPEDWSAYSKLCVEIESYNNDWGKVYFSTDGDYSPEQSFSTINSKTTVTLNFDSEKATGVKQIGIQNKAAGDVIKISRVYLVEKVEYQEGKAIEFDEWGNILASEFAGYSDNAKVEFTVNVAGDVSGVIGWGIGSIKSINKDVTVGDLGLKQAGDNVYTYTIGELKAALEAPADEYGRQGLYWNVWPQGSATCTRKSVMVYEVAGIETNIQNVAAENVANDATYNLAGQKVNEGYKGLVIKNGKKYIQK